MRKYCVYVHRRKDNNLPFYIGCCTRQDNRKASAVKKYQRAFDFGQRRERWFEIKKAAGGVNVEIAFTFDKKEDAFQKECEMINLYGREKFNNGLLVNECYGGNGAPGQYNSDKTRKKKSVTKIGKLNPMYGRCGKKHPTAKQVINIKTNEIYESITQAASKNGYDFRMLHTWLTGARGRKNPTELRLI